MTAPYVKRMLKALPLTQGLPGNTHSFQHCAFNFTSKNLLVKVKTQVFERINTRILNPIFYFFLF